MKISTKSIIIWSFTIISTIIFSNLNGVLWGVLGIRAPLSPIIMAGVLLVVYFTYKKNYEIRHSSLLLLFFAFFFFYLIVGTIMAGFYPEMRNPNATVLKGLRSYVPTLFIVLAFYKFTTYSSSINYTKKLIVQLLILFSISAFLVVISPYMGFTVDIYSSLLTNIEGSSRAKGIFANPNDASLVACYSLAICLYSTMIFNRGRIFIFILAGMAMYANFSTFSKAGLIVMLLILIFYLGLYAVKFWKIRTFQRKSYLMSTLGIFLASALIVNQWSDIIGGLNAQQLNRIVDTQSILGGTVNEENTTERAQLWKLGVYIISKNPVTGFGLQSFHRLNPPFDYSQGLKNYGVHNTFLMLIGEAGIICLLLFIAWIIGIIYQSTWLRDPSLMFFVLSITLVFLVQHAGASHNALSARLSPALMAICMGLIEMGKKYPYRMMILKGK